MTNVRVPCKGVEFCHYSQATERSVVDGRLTASEASLCLLLWTVYPSFIYRHFRKICEKRLLASSCLSVSPLVWNNLAVTERIFMKFDIWLFFENVFRNFKFHYNMTRMTGTLHDDQCTFMVISRWFLLKMEYVSNKICRENQNTHFGFSKIFPKFVPFMLRYVRMWYSQTGHR
jgi:hypothetical protein